MGFHISYDRLVINIGALLLRKYKYFRNSIDSPRVVEALDDIELQIPIIDGPAYYEARALTPVGLIDPRFRIAQWKGEGYPTIIYHHDINEQPYVKSFNKIFPIEKIDIPANLIAIEAPFQSSTKKYLNSIGSLSNFVNMLAVSTMFIEYFVDYCKERGASPILVAGTSLGGWITNMHHSYYNNADYYTPVLAGTKLGDVFFDTVYRKLTSDLAFAKESEVRKTLNFEKDFKSADPSNVYPLLAKFDQYIIYEIQKSCYGKQPIKTVNKGHNTTAMSYDILRNHILNVLMEKSVDMNELC